MHLSPNNLFRLHQLLQSLPLDLVGLVDLLLPLHLYHLVGQLLQSLPLDLEGLADLLLPLHLYHLVDLLDLVRLVRQ